MAVLRAEEGVGVADPPRCPGQADANGPHGEVLLREVSGGEARHRNAMGDPHRRRVLPEAVFGAHDHVVI